MWSSSVVYMEHITTMQNSGEMNIMLDLGECDEYGAHYHHTEFRRDEHPAGPRSVLNAEHITTIQDSGEMNIMQGLGG